MTTNSKDALHQTFHVFGASGVIENANSQHRAAVDLGGRHQVIAFFLDLIANSAVELISFCIAKTGLDVAISQYR